MELISVENIIARYDKEVIIEDISFIMKEKEFTALLGLNGTGKTTLLKVISGLLNPIRGKCLIKGKNIYHLDNKERARYISFMPQRNSIVYDTKVLDIVLMGITPYLKFFQTPIKEHKQKAYNILKKMNIEGLANENFLYLSEGQKQLITIARNLMQDSYVMLFDEPDSALDFNNKHMILKKIKEIIDKENKTGLITLHDPNMALAYCDRIIILKDRKKIADFNTKDVDKDFIEYIFGKIYGNISILDYDDKYLIVK